VGNKTDLEADRQVQLDELKMFAHKHNAKYCETSAKDSKSVEAAFNLLGRESLREDGDDQQSSGED